MPSLGSTRWATTICSACREKSGTIQELQRRAGSGAAGVAGAVVDLEGVVHISPPAPFEAGVGDDAFGALSISTRIISVWTGTALPRESVR